MKRPFLAVAGNCFLIVLSFTACRKEQNTSPIRVDKKKLSDLFAPLRYTPQNFTVDAGVQSRIIGADSTVITFYPNSFLGANGDTIRSGQINIGLIEMYRPGDMIANWTETISYKQVLTSGGQVQIIATKDGQEVRANKYAIAFPQPAATNQPMELYSGVRGPMSSATGQIDDNDPTIRWTGMGGAKSGMSAQGTRSLSVSTQSYYLFDSCTKFNYVNCDHPYDGHCQDVSFAFSFPDKGFEPQNTYLTVCYPAKNIVLSPTVVDYSGWERKIKYKGYVPVGVDCTFVLMTSKEGKYYYYQTSKGATDGAILSASMTEKSLDEIRALLKEL